MLPPDTPPRPVGTSEQPTFPPPPPPGYTLSSTPPATPALPRSTSGKAIAALVLGLCGLFVLPIVCSVLAIVFGALALGEIQASPRLDGRGMAIAGLVCGIAGLALWPLVFFAAM